MEYNTTERGELDMRYSFVISMVTVLVLALAGLASATNGYQLIGVGQIQKSMGGAVTAAPMDSMTAITNPAGMARVGNRADFSIEMFMPARSVDFGAYGGGKTEGGSKMYGIPAIGWTAPAFDREGMFFGGGMYGTSGLGVDYDQTVIMQKGGPMGLTNDVTFSGYSSIMFWKMSPTVAWSPNERTSLGVSLNLDYQSVAITQKFRYVPFWTAPPGPSTVVQQDINFDLGRPTSQLGYGFTVGGLYDMNDMITLGASYSSKQSFSEAEFRVGDNDVLNYNGATGKAGTYLMDLEYPQQLALGVAVTPTEKLLIAGDIKWINWSDTHDKVKFSGPAGSFNPAANPTGSSSSTDLEFGWEDQWVYALGVQYAMNENTNLRAGYNYSKAPIDEADVFNNLVFPAIVEQHFSVGFDHDFGDHWGIAGTYMKAFKEEIKGKGDVAPGMDYATPFSSDSDINISLEEDSVGMQVYYLF
jgi:long-chain fatty acid transport protein